MNLPTKVSLLKGYKPSLATIANLLNAVKVNNPRTVASVCLGEHIPDEVATEIALWLTACAHAGVTVKQMTKLFDDIEEDTDGIAEGFAITKCGDDEEYWEDRISIGDILELYTYAAKKADRFVWFNDNAFLHLVALRGDPGAAAIEAIVAAGPQSVLAGGTQWPAECGVNVAIASIYMSAFSAVVHLRDGRAIKVDCMVNEGE